MDKNPKFILYIIPNIICLLLCNQAFHLHHLYQQEKLQYQYSRNKAISSCISIFNIKMHSDHARYYFNANTNELKFFINNQHFSYNLDSKKIIQDITIQVDYDIRAPKLWTLKNLYYYFKENNNSSSDTTKSLQFVLTDSTGKIKDTYPHPTSEIPSSPEYIDTLGFLTRDILYATYDYPLTAFVQIAAWPIATTLFISLLLAFCVIHLYINYRNEKRQRENQKEYIDSIVHDLKHPVENQKHLCYLLPHLSKEEQIEQAEKNRQDLNNMLHSIDRMLLQSTDAHGIVLTPKTFNLQEMLALITAPDRWNTREGKSFHIRLRFEAPDPMISGDPHFLQAVFQNLIDNALKYSGEEVEIDITCTAPNNKQMLITIQDNGQGIPPRALRHVFERYHRAHHQGDKKTKGHGLGLYHSRQVILAHGGKINIDSSPGNGTTFTITLPRIAKKQKY